MYKFLVYFFVLTVFTTAWAAEADDAAEEAPACHLPIRSGACDQKYIRYGYNTSTGKCDKFVFHGCDGNDNNFMTLDECEATCAI